LDLALVGIILWTGDTPAGEGQRSLAAVVPGVASTLLLLLAALRLDAEAGHMFLLGRNLPVEMLLLVGIAGLLRLSAYPLHPRGEKAPQDAAAFLLPLIAGIFLLARVQALAPVLSGRPWLIALGIVGLLAGGLMAWSGSLASTARGHRASAGAGFWTGILVHQAGLALLFAVLAAGISPWPLVSVPLALGGLVAWWAAQWDGEEERRLLWLEGLWQRSEAWRTGLWQRGVERFPFLATGRASWLGRIALLLVPVIILASLAGAPFTAGLRARWFLYAVLLRQGNLSLLVLLAADTLLAASLWIAFRGVLSRPGTGRLAPIPLAASALLAAFLVLPGIAPGILDLGPSRDLGVSVWGLGLVFVLPWLLGAWLARLTGRLRAQAHLVHAAVDLNWLFRGLGWAGERLVSLFFWLGQVGEGEGWWGWALIILALGAIFLIVR
jgi:hypothetical protein